MSFSSDVKHEITQRELSDAQVRAQISGFMHLNASLRISNRNMELQIEISNPTIAKQMYSLLKARYDVDMEFLDLQTLP